MNQEALTVLAKSSHPNDAPPGNTLSDTHNSYTWNAESEIKTAAGVTYTYDGDGDRVQKSNGKIYWYGAGTEILDESDSAGNITDEYVFFAGQRAAHRVVSTNAIYYYAQDMLGSSRQIYTSAGIVCYDADFYPFGGERAYTNTCAQNYKFEGKERDTETNNDDFGARYYSSAFGRWTSPDWSAIPAPVPYANLTNPQTLNLYSMARDNPETFADLDGHHLQAIADAMEQEFIEHRESGQGSASKQPPPPPPPPTQQQNPVFKSLDRAAAASARADQKLQKKNSGECGSLVYSADGKTFTYTTPVTQGQRTTVDPFNTTGVPLSKTVDLRDAPIPSGTQLYAETHSHPDNVGFSGEDVQRAHDLTIPYNRHPNFQGEYVGLPNGNVIKYDPATGRPYTFGPGQP